MTPGGRTEADVGIMRRCWDGQVKTHFFSWLAVKRLEASALQGETGEDGENSRVEKTGGRCSRWH